MACQQSPPFFTLYLLSTISNSQSCNKQILWQIPSLPTLYGPEASSSGLLPADDGDDAVRTLIWILSYSM